MKIRILFFLLLFSCTAPARAAASKPAGPSPSIYVAALLCGCASGITCHLVDRYLFDEKIRWMFWIVPVPIFLLNWYFVGWCGCYKVFESCTNYDAAYMEKMNQESRKKLINGILNASTKYKAHSDESMKEDFDRMGNFIIRLNIGNYVLDEEEAQTIVSNSLKDYEEREQLFAPAYSLYKACSWMSYLGCKIVSYAYNRQKNKIEQQKKEAALQQWLAQAQQLLVEQQAAAAAAAEQQNQEAQEQVAADTESNTEPPAQEVLIEHDEQTENNLDKITLPDYNLE